MSKVYLFMADGFEEVEALTVVDLLRRAGVKVITVSIDDELTVLGSNNILVKADTFYADCNFADADMLILPGGGLGTDNLESYDPLCKMLVDYAGKGGKIAAICAAPRIFAKLGLLEGKKATCYPSVMEMLKGAQALTDSVVVDGNITTSRGVGTAIDFALELITQLCGSAKADAVAHEVVYR